MGFSLTRESLIIELFLTQTRKNTMSKIFIHVTPVSRNEKTGPIPVTTSSKNTCPDSCQLKGNGCYADTGHVNIHWQKVSKGERGLPFDDALDTIKALPSESLVRHNQAGDLPGIGDVLLADENVRLAAALTYEKKRPFSYTHYPVLGNSTTAEVNRGIIKHINHKGFVVNLSANNLEEADSLADLAIAPIVTILPIDAGKGAITPQGRKVVTCPATYKEGVTCASCKLCAEQRLLKNGKERCIIGFPAHGVQKRKAEKVFMMKREVSDAKSI